MSALETAKDEKALAFFSGVLILLDAVSEWNKKHVDALERLGMHEMAEICRQVPEHPAETFHQAVQSFFMQYILVMCENPYGGNGPGRLDYYLWPYLERDLGNGMCTLEIARELISELFLRIDERIHSADGWVEAVVVGGSFPDGTSAVNPLSFIMTEAVMGLDISHPSVYIRLPEEVPADFMALSARYLMHGRNRAQILSDRAITGALVERGIPYADAAEYMCGGCMEIVPQGMNSDFLFNGWHNIPKFVELAITGGKCLKTCSQLPHVQFRGLVHHADFETFYSDFEREFERILHIFFRVQDVFSEEAEKSRPAYLVSSMIDDCLSSGRNMHGGGARYHDYGSAPIGLPNAADALHAVKKAVFDDKFCTAEELVRAMEMNFSGHEPLRSRLRALPKYGQDNDEADRMASRLMTSVCNAYGTFVNRWGGHAKPVVLTFVWAPEAGAMLGASADGNYAGKPVAQGITPQSSSMTKGITSAIRSNLSMPMGLFSGGASTMWDFDPAWVSEELLQNILTTFIQGGGQIFQGNTTSVRELIKARENPEEYGHLIVRVGGYSARFVGLDRMVQDDVIARYRHLSL
jgi:formate C-acetyltransferase